MRKKVFKIMQQAVLLGVACFLLSIALSRALSINDGLGDVDIGTHGNIALVLTLIFGVVFGMGLAIAFFVLARKQSADE